MSTTTTITKAAAALGRKGGKSTSEAKTAAARENGEQGGRPRINPIRYYSSNRHGTRRGFTRKADAVRYAKAEVADGWPAHVKDAVSGAIVWEG